MFRGPYQQHDEHEPEHQRAGGRLGQHHDPADQRGGPPVHGAPPHPRGLTLRIRPGIYKLC